MTTAKKAAAPKRTAASGATSAAATTEETPPVTPDEAATAAPLDPPADARGDVADAEGNNDAQAEGDGEGDGEASDDTAPADEGSTVAASGAIETGPMTGAAAAPESSARPPATIVNESPAAAPLDPPADSHTQRQPALGHAESSTDHTYAEVGGRTIAGENLVALVTQDLRPVDVDDMFEDPGTRFTHMVSKHRVYELFTYPNTKTPNKRLIFAAGAHVPKAQAFRIIAAAKADVAAAASAAE